MTDINKAIKSLRPNSSFGVSGDRIKWNDPDNKQPTETEINDKIVEIKAEYNALAYSRKREAEYPSVQECVHAILDDTLDALQAKRAEIKTKFPKG